MMPVLCWVSDVMSWNQNSFEGNMAQSESQSSAESIDALAEFHQFICLFQDKNYALRFKVLKMMESFHRFLERTDWINKYQQNR